MMMLIDWRTEEHEAMMTGAVHAAPVVSPDLAALRIFPVKAKDKRPLMKGWQNAVPIDLDVVSEWQETYPGCNWGAALDADTLVIDCDSDASLSALYDQGESLGGIPSTLTTLTPRGFHLWFRIPVPVKNRVAVMPGVDVRSKGGFVVVPPSVGASGEPYKFASLEVPMADAPEWILRLVGRVGEEQEQVTVEPVTVEAFTPFERDITERIWEKRVAPDKVPAGRSPLSLRILLEPETVTKGTRNALLAAYLCRLRGEGKDEESLRSEARWVVSRIPEPLSQFEVEKIIANVTKPDTDGGCRSRGGHTLASAWRVVEKLEAGRGKTKWFRFLLLVEELSRRRPAGILLPVVGVGKLMNVHHKQVTRWRRRAEKMGILMVKGKYVRRRLATEYTVKAGFAPSVDGPAAFKSKRARKVKTKIDAVEAVAA